LLRSHHLGIAALALAGALGVIAVSSPSFGADPFSRERPAASEPSRRGHELDELRRQDVAMQLGARGVPAVWQQQALAELIDWRERFDAARSLSEQGGPVLDWRAYSLAELTDLRLRAAKAGALEAQYGIAVDWRRYSWVDLERLRLSLVALHPVAAPPEGLDADGLAAFDPNRRPSPRRKAWQDRDAIVEPVFASTAMINAERGFVNRGPRAADPDGVVAPTFGRAPRRTERQPAALRPGQLQPDDLINPWRAR